MKWAGIAAAAALQVVILGYMAGEREWIARTGRRIYLRTAPLDPRDVMRGDYVRLDYEIARVPKAFWRDGLITTQDVVAAHPRDTRVYAALDPKHDGVAELLWLSDKRPAQGLFIRGRSDPWSDRELRVRYGVEAYFMEQGTALALEQGRNRDGMQVPLEMEVAVSPAGLAVLKGHRWSPLGIGLELTHGPASSTNRPGESRVQAATLRLLNNSKNDLAIVDLPGGRSLALLTDFSPQEQPLSWVHSGQDPPRPEPAHVVLLRPGQTHEIRVDFRNPDWFVVRTNQPSGSPAVRQPIGEVTDPWSVQLRLVYRPPEEEACKGLPNSTLIWHGRLPSRAFTPRGRVD